MCNDAGLADTGWFHLNQFTFAYTSDLFDHCAGVFVVNVDCCFLDWLHTDTIDFLEQNLWT